MATEEKTPAPLVLEAGFVFLKEMRHGDASALHHRAQVPIPLVLGGQEVGTVQSTGMAMGSRPTTRIVQLKIVSVAVSD